MSEDPDWMLDTMERMLDMMEQPAADSERLLYWWAARCVALLDTALTPYERAAVQAALRYGRGESADQDELKGYREALRQTLPLPIRYTYYTRSAVYELVAPYMSGLHASNVAWRARVALTATHEVDDHTNAAEKRVQAELLRQTYQAFYAKEREDGSNHTSDAG